MWNGGALLNAIAQETEMVWVPLSLTAVVLVLAIANVAPAGSGLSAFRNGALLLAATIATATVWLMWAAVLR